MTDAIDTMQSFGTVIIGAVSAVFGSITTIVVARIRKAPDVQEATSAAVAGIIRHYTEALHAMTAEQVAMRADLVSLRETVTLQNLEIAELNMHIIDLSAALDRHGITPPPRRGRRSAEALMNEASDHLTAAIKAVGEA